MWRKIKQILDVNPLTSSGTLDVIIVETETKNLRCSAFNLKIGKYRVLKPNSREIKLVINGKLLKKRMKLSKRGIAHFEIPQSDIDIGKSHRLIQKRISADIVEKNSNKKKRKPRLSEFISVNEDDIKNINKNSILLSKTSENYNFDSRSNEDDLIRSVKDGIKFNVDNNIKIKKTLEPDNEIFENLSLKNIPNRKINIIQISLCGNLIDNNMSQEEIMKIFDKYKVNIEEFFKDPKQILRKNYMIKIKNKIYGPEHAQSILLTDLAFKSKFPNHCFLNLCEKDETKSYKNMIKSTKPSEQFLRSLNLNEGINSLIYIVKGNFGKEYRFNSRIFFYKFKPHNRIIVSDVDGTITKSDVFGHVLPRINIDWAHEGIAEFYTNLKKRGYIIVYLTSRNIGQAKNTSNYLKNFRQGKYKLPEGPLITSLSSMLEALHRELIIKSPEVFKIKVLRELKYLFRFRDYNPIFAGFGNKSTDAYSYKIVRINQKRIFIINTKSIIFLLNSDKMYTYSLLNKNIDIIFPFFDPFTFYKETEQ